MAKKSTAPAAALFEVALEAIPSIEIVDSAEINLN